jgi:hypothetical protein
LSEAEKIAEARPFSEIGEGPCREPRTTLLLGQDRRRDPGQGQASTYFRVSALDRYEVHRVGGRIHDEYWIPADELDQFNDNIVGEFR